MAEATKIDWAEELREEMKRGREGAAKNALSGEDDTFAEWSESFEEGQSPADLAGAESEGAGVGWTAGEILVPGVGEAMDLRMMEEGRQEGDQAKVAMGMIGLALPGVLGAAWRKLGGPVARRIAKRMAKGELTPKQATILANGELLAAEKRSLDDLARRGIPAPEDSVMRMKNMEYNRDFLHEQPDEWFSLKSLRERQGDLSRNRMDKVEDNIDRLLEDSAIHDGIEKGTIHHTPGIPKDADYNWPHDRSIGDHSPPGARIGKSDMQRTADGQRRLIPEAEIEHHLDAGPLTSEELIGERMMEKSLGQQLDDRGQSVAWSEAQRWKKKGGPRARYKDDTWFQEGLKKKTQDVAKKYSGKK